MVNDQHHVTGVFNNRPLGAHFMVVELQQRAIGVDTADAENAVIKTKLGDKVQGGFTDDTAIPAAQLAAGKDNAEVLFHHQRIGDVEVIGDDTQIVMVKQRMGYRFRRGTDIDKQRRAVGDFTRHLAGDALFFLGLGRFPVVPGSIHRAGRKRGAAVMTQDHFLIG